MDTTNNIIERPSHYTHYATEPVQFIMENNLPFWMGNVVKYALRAGYKRYPDKSASESEVLDLRKVIRYCEMRINQIEGRDVL